jgi:transposase
MGLSLVLPDALDRDVSEVYVARILMPALRTGQTVVLEILAVHKNAAARRVIKAAGCELRFLPTSSPEPNSKD